MFKLIKKNKIKLLLLFKKGNGFSIIELLVVISVITVIVGTVISNFPKIKFQFALSRTAYKFAQDLRRAQDMSLSKIEFKDLNGQIKSVDGYGLYMNIDTLIDSSANKKYTIYADHSDQLLPGNQQYDLLDYMVEIINISSAETGVIIKDISNVSGNEVSVNFNSANLNTKITPLNQNQNSIDVTFALEHDLSKTRSVSINTSGLIEVK